jgi:hypothetical protein
MFIGRDDAPCRRERGSSVSKPTQINILQVETAMSIVEAHDLSIHSGRPAASLWYDDAEINHVLAAGQERGWVYRGSTTQVHWTPAGVSELQAAREAGQLVRVWWIPQMPKPIFHVMVESINEGVRFKKLLADYDDFLLKHELIPDYSGNVGGIEVFDPAWLEPTEPYYRFGEWIEWLEEEADDHSFQDQVKDYPSESQT